MTAVTKTLASVCAALSLGATPALAEEQASPGQPVRLSDHELDEVTAGEGLLDTNLFVNVLLKDIAVNVNVSNVPINAGAVVQANALGTAAQTATVQALQEVTQIQSLPMFPTMR